VHGAADRSPFESYGESGLMERGPSIATLAKPWALSPGWLS